LNLFCWRIHAGSNIELCESVADGSLDVNQRASPRHKRLPITRSNGGTNIEHANTSTVLSCTNNTFSHECSNNFTDIFPDVTPNDADYSCTSHIDGNTNKRFPYDANTDPFCCHSNTSDHISASIGDVTHFDAHNDHRAAIDDSDTCTDRRGGYQRTHRCSHVGHRSTVSRTDLSTDTASDYATSGSRHDQPCSNIFCSTRRVNQ